MDEQLSPQYPLLDDPSEQFCIARFWDTRPHVPDVLHREYYRVQEVADLLGINPTVIRHAVRTGELKAERQGANIVCICREDLLAWLNARGPGV